jgi:hypothetical protein
MVNIVVFEPNATLQLVYIRNYLILAVSTLIFLAYNHYILHEKSEKPAHITLSAIIIFLVVDPSTEWWVYPILIGSAIFAKAKIRRHNNEYIVNPAAFGICIATIITWLFVLMGYIPEPITVSWWGGDLDKQLFQLNLFTKIIPFAIIGMYVYMIRKYERLWYASIFFTTYALLFAVGSIGDVTRGLDLFALMYGLLFSSLSFISFIMITAPHVSPPIRQQQIVLGFLGGALGYVMTLIIPSFTQNQFGWSMPIPLILTILILNIMTLLMKKYHMLDPAHKAKK